ncbi:MAG TPA: hypothetical protein VGQ12_07845 [Candidatus Angelobacter sp.]|jgi:hypothetical protein|nr:hypothetical protein [Candidatus Angelobacter sp.]
MIDDRNKTGITKAVTAAAVRYLDERGCKPIETEVTIGDAWVADVAGVVVPTQTELIALKLLKRRPNYRHTEYQAWYRLAAGMQKLMTVLVEVKTSRSDFRGDKKWARPIPTNLAYLAFPRGLSIGIDEVPRGWGMLEYSEDSDCVKCYRVPIIVETTTEAQLSVIHNIAVRRDHLTRYESERRFRREMVANRNEDVSRTRVATAIRAVMAVVNGHSMSGRIPHSSVEEALKYHGIKHVSGWDMEQLEKLWRQQVIG